MTVGASSTPSPADEPDAVLSVASWLRHSSAVARRSFLPLLCIQLAVFVPVAVIVAILGVGTTSFALPPGFRFFFYQLDTDVAWVRLVAAGLGTLGLVASVFVIVRDMAGRSWSTGELVGFTGRRFVPLLLWIIVTGVLTALGFVLLILPGIYLLVVFSGALLGVVTIERGGLRRTFDLVHPVFLAVLGRLLLLGVLRFVYTLVVFVIAAAPTWGAYPGDPVMTVSQLLFTLLSIPIAIFTISALVVLYRQLRARGDDHVDAATLADELDRR